MSKSSTPCYPRPTDRRRQFRAHLRAAAVVWLVYSTVFGLRHNQQVFYRVVGPDSVDVMNVLAVGQRTAEVFFNEHPMFENVPGRVTFVVFRPVDIHVSGFYSSADKPWVERAGMVLSSMPAHVGLVVALEEPDSRAGIGGDVRLLPAPAEAQRRHDDRAEPFCELRCGDARQRSRRVELMPWDESTGMTFVRVNDERSIAPTFANRHSPAYHNKTAEV